MAIAWEIGTVHQGGLRLSDLLGALSQALDLTEGQPPGHCIRCCWIGMQIGRELDLPDTQLWELYYTLLLKDLGCSSNAARICRLYLADDISFKRDYKTIGEGLPQAFRFVLAHTGLRAGLSDRFRAILNIARNGGEIARELIETRCDRGATIARQMRFSDGVAAGIRCLDEHWNGGGLPDGLVGDAIPLYAQIALLAQIVDVFHASAGADSARLEVAQRAGSWFDPALAEAFARVAAGDWFWTELASPSLSRTIFELEPARHVQALDEDYLDDIATAFAQVVDSKSPWTSGHSQRVAILTDLVAETLAMPAGRRRWLRRGALLHDIGKLGVSNSILDKAGKLDETEWVAMRNHTTLGETILSGVAAFDGLAHLAASHHERLDGRGYPRGLAGDAIGLETRILTVSDIFDALTAERPYRAAMPAERAFAIMEADVGTAIDGRCLDALRTAMASLDARPVAQAA